MRFFSFIMQARVGDHAEVVSVSFRGHTVEEARAARDAERSKWGRGVDPELWEEVGGYREPPYLTLAVQPGQPPR